MRAACAAWPGVEVEAADFGLFLASRVPAGEPPDAYVRRLRTSDLYLACACARGDARALAEFERRCLSVVDETLLRMSCVDRDVLDDVKQVLRCRLLLAEGGAPQILEFSGRGDLRRWLRVMAVREALAMTRRKRTKECAEEKSLGVLLAAGDPQLAYLKHLYQSEFALALADAVASLDEREQTLLRRSFVDGLSVDGLSRLFRIHRATAARRLARARRHLSRRTRVVLTRRLKLQPAELSSMLRFIRSGLEVNLPRVFAAHSRQRRSA